MNRGREHDSRAPRPFDSPSGSPEHVHDLLPAYLNGTLDPPTADRLVAHLAGCAACQAELRAWQAIGAAVRTSVPATLQPSRRLLDRVFAEIDPEVTRAAASGGLAPPSPVQERMTTMLQPERTLRRSRLLRPLVGAAAAAALAAAVIFTPVGSYAQGFLTIFTPRQIVAVSVTQDELASLPDLNNYGTFTQPAHPQPQRVASAAAAAAVSGMTVLVPSTLPKGVPSTVTYEVMPGQSASFTFSAVKARATAARQGKTLPPMPANVDGSTLQVTTGAAVVAIYRDASDQTSMVTSAKETKSPDELASQMGPTLVVGQMAAPVVTSTGASAAEIEQYLLAQPGISPALADAIRAIGDPTSTLPIPVPIDRATSHPVVVQGVQGLAVADSTGLGGGIVWQKNGIIYGVAGSFSESDLLAVANSLH